MTTRRKVAIIVGSLRRDSLCRKLALVIQRNGISGWRSEIIEIRDLPLYNEDLDTDSPPLAWVEFREQIKSFDAVLFVTPEYNRSIPSPLKNALDVASRPYGKSAWQKKPAAVISLSPGPMGGFGANHHLRQCLVYLDMIALAQPEAYIGSAYTLFNDLGELSSDEKKTHLNNFLAAFESFLKESLEN